MSDSGSILTETKKVIGFDDNYTEFDVDIIMHINSALADIHQIVSNVGQPPILTDKAMKWSDVTTERTLINIKSYVWASVRLAFDPPTTSFGLEALKNLKQETAWRLNVAGDAIEETV